MKIAAVSMIKNECDVLELFIRINSRIFDAIFFLDHLSDDSSPEIISAMKRSGFPLHYARWNDPAYEQSRALTWAVHQVARLGEYDYIMPLDADEFLFVGGSDARDVLAATVPRSGLGRVPWRTYCPTTGDFMKLSAPLYEDFRMRDSEPKQFFKVILGADFAQGCTVEMGSHHATHPRRQASAVDVPFQLQHVPVRSSEQIVKKTIVGSHAFALKTKRKPTDGFHWDLLAQRIRESNYTVDAETLMRLALEYATPARAKPATGLAQDAPRVGRPTDQIEFRELAAHAPIRAIDQFLATVIEKLRTDRSRAIWQIPVPWKPRRAAATAFGAPPGGAAASE